MTGSEEIKENFVEFLDKYCSKHKVTREEAIKHAQVIETGKHYGVDELLIVEILSQYG